MAISHQRGWCWQGCHGKVILRMVLTDLLHMPLFLRIFALFAASLILDAGAADKTLGNFRDWSAVQFGASKDLACMAFSQPKHSAGKYTKRGEAFFFVTHRPGTRERDRVSVETGYTYKKGSAVLVRIGKLELQLSTGDSTAWLDSGADAKSLIQAMRAGREMTVTGTSSRGNKTEDRYSLYGFGAAYRAISKSCAKKQ